MKWEIIGCVECDREVNQDDPHGSAGMRIINCQKMVYRILTGIVYRALSIALVSLSHRSIRPSPSPSAPFPTPSPLCDRVNERTTLSL